MSATVGRVVCVAPVGNQCGEAATWVPDEGVLYWTDVNRFLVHRLTPASGAVETWYFDEPCVALFLTDQPGVLLLAIGSKVIRWEPATDERRDFGFSLEGWPEVRLNDGRPGPGGEAWIGSMANNCGPEGEPGEVIGRRGELYRLAAGKQEIFRTDIGISNTVCFSPDRSQFYFGDTVRNLIWRYDYDIETRSISNETPFFEGFDRGAPDGSTVDCEGYLWNCRFGGGCVVRVAPDGTVDEVIEMPCTNITTCEFGGGDLSTLYVTTAAMMIPGYERLAGSLFSINTSVPGSAPLRVML
ncbi:MAG: SMP-30/gluconolactonase/LRE family protein [Pseudomonadota bacterium]